MTLTRCFIAGVLASVVQACWFIFGRVHPFSLFSVPQVPLIAAAIVFLIGLPLFCIFMWLSATVSAVLRRSIHLNAVVNNIVAVCLSWQLMCIGFNFFSEITLPNSIPISTLDMTEGTYKQAIIAAIAYLIFQRSATRHRRISNATEQR